MVVGGGGGDGGGGGGGGGGAGAAAAANDFFLTEWSMMFCALFPRINQVFIQKEMRFLSVTIVSIIPGILGNMGTDVDTPPMFLPTSRTLESRPTASDFSPSIRRTFLRQDEREGLKEAVHNVPAVPTSFTVPPSPLPR